MTVNLILSLFRIRKVFISVSDHEHRIYSTLTYVQTEWSPTVVLIFSCYRILVFLWILFGLIWVGGLVQLVTEKIRRKTKKLTIRRMAQGIRNAKRTRFYTTKIQNSSLFDKVFCECRVSDQDENQISTDFTFHCN